MDKVIDYILSTREPEEKAFWFIGVHDKHGEGHVIDTMRGSFGGPVAGTDIECGDCWFPTEDEACDCCLDHMPTHDDPYLLLKHCATREHVEQLVKNLSDAEIGYLYRLASGEQENTDDE